MQTPKKIPISSWKEQGGETRPPKSHEKGPGGTWHPAPIAHDASSRKRGDGSDTTTGDGKSPGSGSFLLAGSKLSRAERSSCPRAATALVPPLTSPRDRRHRSFFLHLLSCITVLRGSYRAGVCGRTGSALTGTQAGHTAAREGCSMPRAPQKPSSLSGGNVSPGSIGLCLAPKTSQQLPNHPWLTVGGARQMPG